MSEMSLVERLRKQAEHAARAMQMLADAKTARQADREDYPELADIAGYHAPTKEQTLEWQAAAALEAARDDLRQIGSKAKLGGDALGNSGPEFKSCQRAFYLLAEMCAEALSRIQGVAKGPNGS